jgi:2-isopropylmalate synthase
MREKEFIVFDTTLDRAEREETQAVELGMEQIAELGLSYYNGNFSKIIKDVGLIRPEYHNIIPFFYLESYRVVAERNKSAGSHCHATVKIRHDKQYPIEAGEGSGPVDAMCNATYAAVGGIFPEIDEVVLSKYLVKTLKGETGSDQEVYVIIEFSDGKKSWINIGISTDIMEASWKAISRGLNYFLLDRFNQLIKINSIKPAQVPKFK